ncbi:uncharacterized protein LOC142338609 isoform X2 [Convolutriloba macropyga]|uniref:uncharacterized protein LOC142338609 isoform X2 n=1 Tax=Convolutriloba macropyga TaxID=536237 RepID=UPI003F51DD89
MFHLLVVLGLAASVTKGVHGKDYSYICERRENRDCEMFKDFAVPKTAEIHEVCASDGDCESSSSYFYGFRNKERCCGSAYCDHYCDARRDPNYKYLCISDRDCENYEAQYGQDSGAECCDDFMCGHSCFWSAKNILFLVLSILRRICVVVGCCIGCCVICSQG